MPCKYFGITCIAAILVLPASGSSIAADPQVHQALPVDEAPQDPALVAFRDRLLDAVERRDIDAVVAMADPNIHLSYGGDHGRDTLRTLLEGVDEMPWSGEAYWQELETALALGGSILQFGEDRGPVFCAPYTFFAELAPDMDPFETVLVIGDAVALRSSPDTDGAVVALLDHDVAQIVANSPGYNPDDPLAPYWLLVRTADGAHEGYLSSVDFRSPIDYRACFSQDIETGTWSWDQFIAGD